MIPESFFQFEDPFSNLGRIVAVASFNILRTLHPDIHLLLVVEILLMAFQISTWLKISIPRRRWIWPRRKWLGTRPRRMKVELYECDWPSWMWISIFRIYFRETKDKCHLSFSKKWPYLGCTQCNVGNRCVNYQKTGHQYMGIMRPWLRAHGGRKRKKHQGIERTLN